MAEITGEALAEVMFTLILLVVKKELSMHYELKLCFCYKYHIFILFFFLMIVLTTTILLFA